MKGDECWPNDPSNPNCHPSWSAPSPSHLEAEAHLSDGRLLVVGPALGPRGAQHAQILKQQARRRQAAACGIARHVRAEAGLLFCAASSGAFSMQTNRQARRAQRHRQRKEHSTSPGPACSPASVRVMHTCDRAEMGVPRLPCSIPRSDAGCHPLLHIPTKNAVQHWLETFPPRPPPPPYPGAPPQTARSRSTGRSRPQTARWPSRAPAGRTMAAAAMHESGATSYRRAAHALFSGKSKRAMQTRCAGMSRPPHPP